MDSETIIESSFEYTDGEMYRTIKVTMPPCDTNDDAAWAERNDLAERIRALLQAPAQPAQMQGWQMVPVNWNELLERVRFTDDESKHHGRGATYWNNAVFACRMAIRDALAVAPQSPVQEPVATVIQRAPYEDGTINPGKSLQWSGNNAEDDLAVGTKLYAAPKPPVQETARNPDVLALNAAREIMALMYGPTQLGGSPQLLAQVQCVVSEAIVYAAPQPSDDVAMLRKQLDEARELLTVASEIIHEQCLHIDSPMTDLGSEALTRLDDWLEANP